VSRSRDARHVPLVSALVGEDEEPVARILTSREVAIDWPAGIEGSRCGRALVRITTSLVLRYCPGVRLVPRTAFASEIAARLRRIDRGADPLRVPRTNAVRVQLGGGARGDVTASSAGWIAHVSGVGEPLPVLVDSDNVIGAHGAAAFAAAETMKRLLPIRDAVAGLTPTTAYCFWSLGVPRRSTPVLPRVALPVTLQGGNGAIGQAVLDVLVSADARGTLYVNDRGSIDDATNLNRSEEAEERDLEEETAKVDLAVRRARESRIHVVPLRGDLRDVIARIETGDLPWPRLVIGAYDNVEARHELQSLWPDVLIDGATGDTMAQVLRVAWGSGGACCRCIFRIRPLGALEHDRAFTAMTGVAPERLAAARRGEVVLAPEEIVDPGVRAMLAGRGRDVCGFLSDFDRWFAANNSGEPTLLSVSFTSYLAGVLVASEVLKAAAGLDTLLPGRYQIDPIATLAPPSPYAPRANPACDCVTTRRSVEKYRRAMERGRR
jgi:hypothetical protein